MVGLARPLASPFENRLELYNSASIVLLIYCLLCFTEFIEDPSMRYDMGYAMILLTAQNILVNLVLIAKQPARRLYLSLKRWFAIRSLRKKMGIKPKPIC